MALFLFSIFLGPAKMVAADPQEYGGSKDARVAEFRNTIPGVAYLGSKVCSECHADIYLSYLKTDMGRSMSLPSEPDQLAKVPTPITVEDRKFNRSFQVFAEGSNLYQSEYELGTEGHEIFRNTQKLEYVIGSGANGSSYVVRRGDYLFEAPLSYYSKSKSWGLSPGYEFGDYGFSRPILAGCIVCHSGLPQPVLARDGVYRDPSFRELAIGCENCHGPGQLHVEERRQGVPPAGDIDRTIVNPAKLPAWLADNVCMNCHQGGETRVLQPGRDYSDFRPGTPLDKTLAVFAVPFSRRSPPHDPLLQHYALMILSQCYRQSGGRLSCTTCHDPHRQPLDREAAGFYRTKCLTCHTDKSCALPLAARLRKNPPDDCASCHLPKQNVMRISHSSLTNHRIVRHEGEPYPEIAFHQTTPELPDLIHLSAVSGSEQTPVPRLTLLKAYGELMDSHPVYRVRYNALLNQLAQAAPNDAFVLSALARSKLAEATPGATTAAVELLSRAMELGSTAAADFELLADMLARSGKTSQAISTLQRGLALNPYSSRLYKALALEYISIKAYREALRIMKRELELFPEDSFMRMLIRKAEAAKSGS